MVYIYVISALLHSVKIGIANDPEFRLRELQVGCPMKLVVAARFKLANRTTALKVERAVHRRLYALRLEGEWFKISVGDAVAEITHVIGGAAKNIDAAIEVKAAKEFRRKACNRILVCPYCQHAKQSALDDNAVRNGKFRCTSCNALFPGRRFLIRRVA